MKKLIIVALGIIFFTSCKTEEPKDYVSLSGKIENKNSNLLSVRNQENKVIKQIKVNEDGTFADTLNVDKGAYIVSDGNEYARLFLQPGAEIIMNLDANKFDETLTFTGKGSEESSYMVKKLLKQEEIFENINDLYELPKDEFVTSLDKFKIELQNLLKSESNLDPDFIQTDISNTEDLFSYLAQRYDKISKINKMIGKPAPEFTNYENYDGSTTSLKDLKGKYTYVDVWATWCKPCLAEIPALKDLEKEFGEKMNFVSISIDKTNKHDAWKQMVADKNLKGFQLFADNNWDSQFVKDFGIDGIPRFILIDLDGNVLKPNAPRPSNPKTKELLSSLLQ